MTAIAIQIKNFVLLAAEQKKTSEVVLLDNRVNKSQNHSILAIVVGGNLEARQFANVAASNMTAIKIQNGYEMSPSAAANHIKNMEERPSQASLLLVGYDKAADEAQLYFMDSSSAGKVPYKALGSGDSILQGVLDIQYTPDMDGGEALGLLRKCVTEVHKDLASKHSTFTVAEITRGGFRILPYKLRR